MTDAENKGEHKTIGIVSIFFARFRFPFYNSDNSEMRAICARARLIYVDLDIGY